MTMPSEPLASVEEPVDIAFIEEAAGNDDPPAPIKGLRRLLWWIIPANLGIFLIWGAVPGILLPAQIAGLDPANKVANLAIVATIGVFAAMLAQPIAGQVSDRTRSRFGRRAPWIIIGALAGGLSLVGLAFANSLVGIVIAWTLVQICYNFAQGPLSAVMPDRVPLARRGTFAALSGIGLMVGALGGPIVGSMFLHSIAAGYVIFAVFSLVVLSLFVVFNPDYSSKDLPREPFSFADFLRTFWVNPVKHPDFFWAFTGRLLLYTGYFAVTGYQLFILTDYLGIEDPAHRHPAARPAEPRRHPDLDVISGPLSDKVGRRKPFVFGSSVFVGARDDHPDGLADAARVDDHDVRLGLRLRHVPGRRHSADEPGAAVGEVVRQGPRRRQHRRHAAADARSRRRRRDRPRASATSGSSRSASC